ncbi:hypothetical protein [Nesterenkonia suensis]
MKTMFGSQRLSAGTIALEAWRRGLSVDFTSANRTRVRIGDGQSAVEFNGSRPSLTTAEAIRIANRKDEALASFRAASVPVPLSQALPPTAGTEEVISLASKHHQWPVVLKPAGGSLGRDVYVNIHTHDELRECYRRMQKGPRGRTILLEDHIAGEDYRIYVIGNRAVGVVRRIPAHVVGDGNRTIRQLIIAKNRHRRLNPFLSKGLIRLDSESERVLARQGMGFGDTPVEGAHIQLRDNANASAGGDVEGVTEDLPKTVLDSAVAAVAAIPGLIAAGVDILYDRSTGNFAAIEINSRPHIGVNMYPSMGEGQNVPSAIIDHFFPNLPPSPPEAMKLSLNIGEIVSPLMSGGAEAVTVATLPQHKYPSRLTYTLTGDPTITSQQNRRLVNAARRLGVSGGLNHTGSRVQLIAAGSNRDVKTFASKAKNILNCTFRNRKEWEGVVYQGFHVDDKTSFSLPKTSS